MKRITLTGAWDYYHSPITVMAFPAAGEYQVEDNIARAAIAAGIATDTVKKPDRKSKTLLANGD